MLVMHKAGQAVHPWTGRILNFEGEFGSPAVQYMVKVFLWSNSFIISLSGLSLRFFISPLSNQATCTSPGLHCSNSDKILMDKEREMDLHLSSSGYQEKISNLD